MTWTSCYHNCSWQPAAGVEAATVSRFPWTGFPVKKSWIFHVNHSSDGGNCSHFRIVNYLCSKGMKVSGWFTETANKTEFNLYECHGRTGGGIGEIRALLWGPKRSPVFAHILPRVPKIWKQKDYYLNACLAWEDQHRLPGLWEIALLRNLAKNIH